jgi:hypothetical protein
MSDGKTRLEQAATMPRSAMEGLTAIAQDAARQNDAGTLGVDGWIRTGHRLVDLAVRAYAGFLQALIAGPWWAAPAPSGAPSPSEPIPVTAQSYQRKFTIVKPFTRVGIPRMRIPNQFIRFEPELLPAGAKEFRIALRNYNFVGANYTGTIHLSKAAAAPGAQPEKPIEVTVGL